MTTRSSTKRAEALERWVRATGSESADVTGWVQRLKTSGRITLNFHPDRIAATGSCVAAGLLADGRYRSQWTTAISNGSRSAIRDGERDGWERALFEDAYRFDDPAEVEFPVYGAFDLLRDPHGGSPRFGSCFVVLRPSVLARTTFCIGDSHRGPKDIGTIDEPLSLLAGLAEQAARGELLDRSLGTEALFQTLRGGLAPELPSRTLDGYIEVQVHGGVELGADVESIVLDPSFRNTHVEHDLSLAAGRFGFALGWHTGSELAASVVPSDFRGPAMPELAGRVARFDGLVDARAIGQAAQHVRLGPPTAHGDPADSDAQQLKYLWHTVLAFGHVAAAR